MIERCGQRAGGGVLHSDAPINQEQGVQARRGTAYVKAQRLVESPTTTELCRGVGASETWG